MIFEEFEGFKKIKNTRNLSIEELFDILDEFEHEMGKLDYHFSMGSKIINIDLKGKYDATIEIDEDEIIIKRVLEEGKVEDRIPTAEDGKKIKMAQADRMIDQIYDLINDYMEDEEIEEVITSSKQTLRMQQVEKVKMKVIGIGLATYRDRFDIVDNDGKKHYEVIDKKFSRTYTIKNIKNNLEVASVNYSGIKNDQITIIEKPFQLTHIKRDPNTEKIKFVKTGTGQDIKITGDYTDNHYQVELDEIVIGAVDCLNPRLRNDYRIEVNKPEKENLLVAIAMTMRVYGIELAKRKKKEEKRRNREGNK